MDCDAGAQLLFGDGSPHKLTGGRPACSARSMTLYRTVANCGRESVMMICAITFPPKAGRICTRSLLSRISSFVQSAVRPV
jgi:hypothetical protein